MFITGYIGVSTEWKVSISSQVFDGILHAGRVPWRYIIISYPHILRTQNYYTLKYISSPSEQKQEVIIVSNIFHHHFLWTQTQNYYSLKCIPLLSCLKEKKFFHSLQETKIKKNHTLKWSPLSSFKNTESVVEYLESLT